MTRFPRLSALLLLAASSSHAQWQPEATAGDPRIKLAHYDPLEVTEVTGTPGFAQTISFAPAERIQTASIGDTGGWQVTPNAVGNKLFLKPLSPRAHTNLSVVTDRRTYNFELTATPMHASGASTYEIRFVYPDDVAPSSVISIPAVASTVSPRTAWPAPDAWNLDYSSRGPADLAPLHVFDDGRFTYFQFRTQTALPAIFAVEADRHETLVNFHVTPRYVVVERTAAQFTLRAARGVVCVFSHPLARDATTP